MILYKNAKLKKIGLNKILNNALHQSQNKKEYKEVKKLKWYCKLKNNLRKMKLIKKLWKNFHHYKKDHK